MAPSLSWSAFALTEKNNSLIRCPYNLTENLRRAGEKKKEGAHLPLLLSEADAGAHYIAQYIVKYTEQQYTSSS